MSEEPWNLWNRWENVWKIKFVQKRPSKTRSQRARAKELEQSVGFFKCVIKGLQNSYCRSLLSGLLSVIFSNWIKSAGPLFTDCGNSAKGSIKGWLQTFVPPMGDRATYIVHIGSFCTFKVQPAYFYLPVHWTELVSALIIVAITTVICAKEIFMNNDHS